MSFARRPLNETLSVLNPGGHGRRNSQSTSEYLIALQSSNPLLAFWTLHPPAFERTGVTSALSPGGPALSAPQTQTPPHVLRHHRLSIHSPDRATHATHPLQRTPQALRLHTHHPLRQPVSAPGKIPAFIGPSPLASGESADQHGVHPSPVTLALPRASPCMPRLASSCSRVAARVVRPGRGRARVRSAGGRGQPQDLPIAAGWLRAKCRCAEKLGRWRFRGFSSPHGRFGRARGVLTGTPVQWSVGSADL